MIQNLKVLMHRPKNIMIQQYSDQLPPILLQFQLNNLTCTFKIISMFVMLLKLVHPIIAIHCNTRYIDKLKAVSIHLAYCDTAMHRCIIPSLGLHEGAD